MRTIFLPYGLLLLLSGCSSDNTPTKKKPIPVEAGSCKTETDSTERDMCMYGTGALAKDTIGGCTGSAIPIQHIVVLMQENRSFDHYYGHLPGNGQDDVDVPTDTPTNPEPGDAGTPIPWHHDPAYCIEDTDHGWVASHREWDNGKNDGFAIANAVEDDPTGQRALGYYDQTDIPFYYDLASTFAISDRYFCSLLGPTYPNRMFLAAGTSFGIVVTDITKLAPRGVNTVYKELDDKGISWKFYYSDLPTLLLFPDLQSDAGTAHSAKIEEFAKDAAAGTLPQVSYVDPAFVPSPNESDEHPPSDIQVGQHFVWEQVNAAMHSPEWPTMAMFVTYDEHGGLYDHVSPPSACVPDDSIPAIDAGGAEFDRLGFRVPMTVISPYAKRHFVSHVVHSHTSVLRFIEAKFELPAMTKRDANSDAMFDFFDFDSPPNLDVPTFTEPDVAPTKGTPCEMPPQLTPALGNSGEPDAGHTDAGHHDSGS